MSSNMIIMRGPSGIGKSTWASAETDDVVVASADDWFRLRGFNPRELTAAHTDCFRRALDVAGAGISVVVDNTNTNFWELWPYVMLGRAFQMRVSVIEVLPERDGPDVVDLLTQLNIHRVPRHVVETQLAALSKPLPRHQMRDVNVRRVIVSVDELHQRAQRL